MTDDRHHRRPLHALRVLREAIERALAVPATRMRTLELPWPDEPMEHGYAKAGPRRPEGVLGDPDAIVAFVGDAEIFVDASGAASRRR